MDTAGSRQRGPGATRRVRIPLLGVLVGTALLVVGLVSLYLVMRTLALDYGGACAVDGPYEIRPGQQCEPGIFTSAYASIAVTVTGGLLLLWSSRRYDAGLILNAAIGVLASLFFAGLGVSFLKVAAAMPDESDFTGVGVAFVVMAVLGLGITVAAIRYGERIGRLDHPKPSAGAWLAWTGALGAGLCGGGLVGALIVRAA